MPSTTQLEVTALSLDLTNYRTPPQASEEDAIRAMISIKPERFFAVMESIVDDEYLKTENIIILNNDGEMIVKEGNRRIASMKLILRQYPLDNFSIPTSLKDKIQKLDSNWLKDNREVPCTIYDISDADKVDKIIRLTHGKGEKASRDPWNSVATARHNRDVNQASEPGLDLLEKYLEHGNNLTGQQKTRWGGEYPLTVLNEALRKISNRFGVLNAVDIASNYPNISMLSELEALLRDIGLELIGFDAIRNTSKDFAVDYGIMPVALPKSNSQSSDNTNTVITKNKTANTLSIDPQQPAHSGTLSTSNAANIQSFNQSPSNTAPDVHSSMAPQNPTSGATTLKKSAKAVPLNDPRHVAKLLKSFTPRGSNREKVVVLRDEIRKLSIDKNPIAFCFLLRSMFEISAKAYCKDHTLSTKKKNGDDKSLVDMLREATNHLTSNNSNRGMLKVLHGAMTEIARTDGILSVTSMNQLVHNPTFSVIPSDVCTLFNNVYPLLEALN